MKTNLLLPLALVTALCLATSCDTATKPAADGVTNPLFKLAPVDYATLAEQALTTLGAADFDAWSAMLADSVEFNFPDGDQNTRTKLKGKAAVMAWWKNYRSVPAMKSMTMTEFNHVPIDVTGQAKGGAMQGITVLSYFTNVQVINGQSVGLRMNFATHFNADKKIDRYTTYYDRTPIVKALGRNLLEEKKAGK